jgi:hypothetical protein
VGFVVDKLVVLGQVFLQVLHFSPGSILIHIVDDIRSYQSTALLNNIHIYVQLKDELDVLFYVFFILPYS